MQHCFKGGNNFSSWVYFCAYLLYHCCNFVQKNVVKGGEYKGGGHTVGRRGVPIEGGFKSFEPSSKLITIFCTYSTLIKIKITMTCVYKKWSENKNGAGAMTTAKNEVFIGWKLLFSGGGWGVSLHPKMACSFYRF